MKIPPKPMNGNPQKGDRPLGPLFFTSHRMGQDMGAPTSCPPNRKPKRATIPLLRAVNEAARPEQPLDIGRLQVAGKSEGNLQEHLESIGFTACFISQTGTWRQLSGSRAARPPGWAAVWAFSPESPQHDEGAGEMELTFPKHSSVPLGTNPEINSNPKGQKTKKIIIIKEKPTATFK